MAKCLIDDCCDNPWLKEILAFRTPRVQKLFGEEWSREQVVKLVVFTIMSGVALASPRGVLLGRFLDDKTMMIEIIFGERVFIKEVLKAWSDLYPGFSAIGNRHGKIHNFKKLYGCTRH
jgi:hypothetical protein